MVEDIATAALPATWMKTAVMGRCAAMALSWRRLPPFWTAWIWSLNNPPLLPFHNSLSSLGGHCLPVIPAASTRTSRTCKETELAFRYFPLCHHIYHPICEEEKWWWDDQEPNLTVASVCILIHFLLPSSLEWLQPLQPLGSWCAELLNFHKCQAIETNDDTHRPLILPTHSVWKLLKKGTYYFTTPQGTILPILG